MLTEAQLTQFHDNLRSEIQTLSQSSKQDDEERADACKKIGSLQKIMAALLAYKRLIGDK